MPIILRMRMLFVRLKKANELNLAVTLKKEHRIITKEPDEYVLETQRYFGNQIGPVEKYNRD